jgi:hypothetical protein
VLDCLGEHDVAVAIVAPSVTEPTHVRPVRPLLA